MDLLESCLLAIDFLLFHLDLGFYPLNIGVDVGDFLVFEVFYAAEAFVKGFSLDKRKGT
jgi:hypothetical protein